MDKNGKKEHTSIRCWLFGHQPPVYGKKGWWSPGEEYAEVKLGAEDGIRRQHATVYCDCPRCGQRYLLCRIHVPTVKSDQERFSAGGIGG